MSLLNGILKLPLVIDVIVGKAVVLDLIKSTPWALLLSLAVVFLQVLQLVGKAASFKLLAWFCLCSVERGV